ncbi:ThiF family adenylyltransferase [Paenibacillus sp. FSL P4-0288]|uniref:ThiF family adenylyltransferase n=1 Tax=Paenibacillus sp. FSL P4-0288 TaxID=2921633 RepID=UPI0030F6D329
MNIITINEKQAILYKLVVVGGGGNGSHFVRSMLQTISGFLTSSSEKRIRFDITLVDGDKVETKNFHRQLFDSEDLGDYKVVSLQERYGDYYGHEVKTVTEYCTTIEMLTNLFAEDDLDISRNVQVVPILFGFVDNNKTRQLFDTFFHSNEMDTLIWIDAGIEGVLHFENPTPENIKTIDYSGFGGQVVCGYKYHGQVIMAPVTRVYSNMLEDEKTFFPDQSCGDTIIENPQRLATNQMAAQISILFFNNLLHNNSIYTHKVNFNAQFAQSKPTFLTSEMVSAYNALKK